MPITAPIDSTKYDEVARERSSDAKVLMDNGRIVAGLYLAGYIVECRLKAYMKVLGKKIEKTHDFTTLLEAVGLKHSDFHGHQGKFIEFWSHELRYCTQLRVKDCPSTLYQGAKDLSGFIVKKMKTANKGKIPRPRRR